MKNRAFLPVVILLVAGLSMLGCPTDDDDDGEDIVSTGPDNLWSPGYVVVDTKEFDSTNMPSSMNPLAMADNFQYDRGYQGKIAWSALFGTGANVVEGEVYELDFEATVSRDMEADILWVIVDENSSAYVRPVNPDWPLGFDDEESSSAYWNTLTRQKVVGMDDKNEDPEQDPLVRWELVNDDREVVAENQLPLWETGEKIISKSRAQILTTGKNASSLTLAFSSDGAGTYKGGAGTGIEKPFNITFSKFTVTKLVWEGDEEDEEE